MDDQEAIKRGKIHRLEYVIDRLRKLSQYKSFDVAIWEDLLCLVESSIRLDQVLREKYTEEQSEKILAKEL